MQPRGRMSEVQLLGDRQKVTKLPEIDIVIHMRFVLIRINNILDVLIGFV